MQVQNSKEITWCSTESHFDQWVVSLMSSLVVHVYQEFLTRQSLQTYPLIHLINAIRKLWFFIYCRDFIPRCLVDRTLVIKIFGFRQRAVGTLRMPCSLQLVWNLTICTSVFFFKYSALAIPSVCHGACGITDLVRVIMGSWLVLTECPFGRTNQTEAGVENWHNLTAVLVKNYAGNTHLCCMLMSVTHTK